MLGPLAGRPAEDWQRAPRGKWTPAQIVEHLALGMEWTWRGFEERRGRPAMTRRPRTVAQRVTWLFIFGIGWVPPVQAPERSRPDADPDPAYVERHFREGAAGMRRVAAELLPARAADLFVKHGRLGDLTISEWLRFHTWHCGHHARQIRARLAS